MADLLSRCINELRGSGDLSQSGAEQLRETLNQYMMEGLSDRVKAAIRDTQDTQLRQVLQTEKLEDRLRNLRENVAEGRDPRRAHADFYQGSSAIRRADSVLPIDLGKRVTEQQYYSKLKMRAGPEAFERKDSSFWLNVARETIEPGTTRDLDASRMSKAMSDTWGEMLEHLEGLGDKRTPLQRYMPQQWNASRLIKLNEQGTGRASWIRDIAPLLDGERILDRNGNAVGEAGLARVAGEAFDSVIQRRPNFQREYGGLAGSRPTRERVLHFKSADAWIMANKLYGAGDISKLILDHHRILSTGIASLEKMGPNPYLTFQVLSEETERLYASYSEGRSGVINAADRLDSDGLRTLTRGIFDDVTHAPQEIGNIDFAVFSRAARNIFTGTKLVRATLSSLGDLATTAHQSDLIGALKHKVFGDWLGGLFGSASSKAARRQLAADLGHHLDLFNQDIKRHGLGVFESDRASPTDPLFSRAASSLSDFTLWASALNATTASFKRANFLGTMRTLGMNRNVLFNDLQASTRRFLENFGITSEDWNIVRRATTEVDGVHYMDINKIEDPRLRSAIHGLALHVTDRAVVEGNPRTRAGLNRQPAGSLGGEIQRAALQFQQFGQSIAHYIFDNFKIGGSNPLNRWARMSSYVLYMAMSGWLIDTLKDMAMGKVPDFSNREYWTVGRFTKWVATSGGFGWLFEVLTDLGGFVRHLTNIGWISALAAATLQLGVGGYELLTAQTPEEREVALRKLGRLGNRAIDNVPPVNYYYTKLFADRLFLDGIRAKLDPTLQKKWERQIKEAQEMGTPYFWAPTGMTLFNSDGRPL